MKKTFILILLFFLSLVVFSQVNPKPFVVPEIQKWEGGEGYFILTPKTKIIYNKNSESVKNIGELLIADLQILSGEKLSMSHSTPKKGDISLKLVNDESIKDEGYKITIDDIVTITANNETGLFWGTQTLLQMSEQSNNLPKGVIEDYPLFKKRGFMLDVGRKYFPIEYLYDCVRIMAYYKMNTFQIHLNDSGFWEYFGHDWSKTYSAFRLESDTYPGLAAKDGHYTKQEFIDLQKYAEKYGINIIPEIDAPAHVLAFTQYKPELGSKEYGMDHFDLFNPETYKFMDALWAEYLSGDEPVFRGPSVHIGTDEYSNKDQKVVEKFRYYTDHYIKHIKSFGKQPYVWGALSHAKGETPVTSEDVVMSAWYNGFADPKEMIKQGYELISIPDGYVYIVPAAGYYYDYLNTEYLYKNWTPLNIGNQTFEEGNPAILGGMFAVWNDHVGNGISVKDVHHRVMPALKTIATKSWTASNVTTPYGVFEASSKLLSEAPGVNVNGRVGLKEEVVLNLKNLKPNKEYTLEEIGYPYTVEFVVNPKEEEKGTSLLSSSSATFYLSDPEDGKLAFSRDGYLIKFDYQLPDDVPSVYIAIEGTNKYTALYVNGELKEKLDIQKIELEKAKPMSFVRTLVFPLKNTGAFNSDIIDFKVSNYLLRSK